MKLALKQDWLHVRIEPAKDRTPGGIVLVGPRPVRMAVVLAAGPGIRNKRGVLNPTEARVGDRFPFFKGATETKQGHALELLLDENEALIRETDVLFVIEEGDPEVAL